MIKHECNQCGQCCMESLCVGGEMAFGDINGPCPALIKKDGVFVCAFVVAEKDFGMDGVFAKSLGIGHGCTNDFKDWDQEDKITDHAIENLLEDINNDMAYTEQRKADGTH